MAIIQQIGNMLHGIANAISPSGRPDPGPVVAGMWPEWERMAPRTQTPSPYTLAMQGYRKNELIYALIQKRAAAVSEPTFHVYDERGDNAEKMQEHSLTRLLRRPNPSMSNTDFIRAAQIYLDIAGVSAWEIEFNRAGEPLAMWPLDPRYCQYLRGEYKPIATIRYIYPGFPVIDIPIERVLLFQEFDPVYPNLMGLSRTAVAARLLEMDNKATDFLDEFFAHGSVVPGLLKTEQQLSEDTAQLIRRRWESQHGGSTKWGQPAVVGSGVTYQSLGYPLKDLDLSGTDGRVEARACMLYETPPILIGAKIGLAASTYSNYAEARKAWYEETITPRWTFLSDALTFQLLPHYGIDPMNEAYAVHADTKKIKALQEDRSLSFTRAIAAAEKNVLTRDEARQEMGYDPIDEKPVFIGVTISARDTATSEVTMPGNTPDEMEKDDDEDEGQNIPAFGGANGGSVIPGASKLDATTTEPGLFGASSTTETPTGETVKTLTDWRKSAVYAVTHHTALPDAPPGYPEIERGLAECKTAQAVRVLFERHWPIAPRQSEIARLALAIERAAAKL